MSPRLLINISLSPNTQRDDVWIAIKALFSPWEWQSGVSITLVQDWFKKSYDTENVWLFSSGRASFYALLKAFDISHGDEVIIQAFTCIAVPEVVTWVGATPRFVDVDDTYNINPDELEKRITKKTKAIVVQHTFGMPADIIRIKNIAKKHNVLLIEDCAHSLGARVNGTMIGLFGDASFFSFGRDKVVSSVFGGAAMLSKKYEVRSKKLKGIYNTTDYPSYFWIVQQLLHPIIITILVIPLYNIIGLGKVLLVVFQKLNLLSFPVLQCEYEGKMPKGFLKKYPNALAILLVNQLNKLKSYNNHRIHIARTYAKKLNHSLNKSSMYLRFPILVSRQKHVLHQAKKRGIVLGNWYHHVIDPQGCDTRSVGYKRGDCPNAERLSREIINLPTHPRMSIKDAENITNIVKKDSNV